MASNHADLRSPIQRLTGCAPVATWPTEIAENTTFSPISADFPDSIRMPFSFAVFGPSPKKIFFFVHFGGVVGEIYW
jgi:hypothetical protein